MIAGHGRAASPLRSGCCIGAEVVSKNIGHTTCHIGANAIRVAHDDHRCIVRQLLFQQPAASVEEDLAGNAK